MVDDQLELRRLLDWQIRRFRALEDLAGIDTDLTISIPNVRSITHQTANFGDFTRCIYRGDRAVCLVLNNLDAPGSEIGGGADEEGIRLCVYEGCESRIDLAPGAGFDALNLQSKGARRRVHFSHRGVGNNSILRIDDQGYPLGGRHQFMQ